MIQSIITFSMCLSTTIITIQSAPVARACQHTDRYTAQWAPIDPLWRVPYEYMCYEMNQRGVTTGGYPPIWAWVEPTERIPQLAIELLSDQQYREGVYALELKVPTPIVVHSSYTHWNNLLSHYLETGQIIPEDELFTHTRVDQDDAIQATIPYVIQDWIQSCFLLHFD